VKFWLIEQLKYWKIWNQMAIQSYIALYAGPYIVAALMQCHAL